MRGFSKVRPMDKVTDVYMEILQDLVKNVGLDGAVLSGVDGSPLASALRPGIEENRLAAISAAALTLGLKVAEEITRGVLEEVTVRSDSGLMLVSGVGEDAVLTAVADDHVKLGFLMMEMKKARSRLTELMLFSKR
ncbi:MAG TPA: roadblock/LC7 domain-containing protein [Thermodesulfobacteriota bacterium]|nr:roadblock/LC7 domain-containing protein [Thermodesulfobacteriota bacterium]